MISSKKFYNRFWWFMFLLAIFLLIFLGRQLEAQVFLPIHQPDEQDIPGDTYSNDYSVMKSEYYAEVYRNGVELMMDTTKIAFIYGSKPFNLKNGGFKIMTATGDTVEIQIKRKTK